MFWHEMCTSWSMKDRRKYILLCLLTGLLVLAWPVDSTQAEGETPAKVEDASAGQDKVDKPLTEPEVAEETKPEPKAEPKTKARKKLRLKPNTPGSASGLLWKMLASVVIIGVLAGLAFFVLRRLGSKLKIAPGRKIKLVETLSLGPGKAIHLVEIESAKILLSTTKTGVSMLTTLDDEHGAKFPTRQELEAMGSE